MKKTIILLLTAGSLVFATQTTTPTQGMKQHKMAKKGKKNAPFLIMGKMPHLTKQVMMNWDELKLSKDQEEKLTKIRQDTIGAVKKLKLQIMTLEDEVAKAAMAGEKPETLKEKVDQIAKLKAEATMVHIKCIYNTKNTLTAKQLELLQ
jgi:hypothetical protein